MDTLLRHNEHCVWYHSVPDCLEQARALVGGSVCGDRVRRVGEAFVRAHHTYDARVPFLLHQLPWVNPLDAAEVVV